MAKDDPADTVYQAGPHGVGEDHLLDTAHPPAGKGEGWQLLKENAEEAKDAATARQRAGTPESAGQNG